MKEKCLPKYAWRTGRWMYRTSKRASLCILLTVFALLVTNALLTPRSSLTHAESDGKPGAAATADGPPAASSIQFSPESFFVDEGAGSVNVNVTRTGDTSAPATIDYATSDGTASERSDYTAALGTLRFAAGETSKTFPVLIADDLSAEGNETVNLALSNATGGAGLGTPSTAVLTILDNDTVTSTSNPIDSSAFYVRQHYLDFLNRDSDTAGFAFWQNNIEQCGADAQCREVQRVNTSAAFFLSIEFQNTGYFIYRLHQASFNTGETLKLQRFLPDAQEISRGVIVLQGNWEQQIEQNKQDFIARFVQRPEFISAYPDSMSAAQFVDTLNSHTPDPRNPNSAGSLAQSERDQLVADLSAGRKSRADVLRAIADNIEFQRRQFNKAFVYMEYIGYLRRNPNDLPDTNFDGYNFWLAKLDQFNGNYIQAEMVKAFISSIEYRARFVQSTRSNQPPVVNAGPDLVVNLPNAAVLNGSATDDGLPSGSSLVISWTKVSGPGGVVFNNSAAAVTSATFSAAGSYVLRLSASDGQFTPTDDVTITVNAQPNQAPVVNAGPDQTITLPANATLNGSATDDGLPSGSSVVVSWSKVSGPSSVLFNSAGVTSTTAIFGVAGTYVLRLSATDGQLISTDDVSVTVNPDSTPLPPDPSTVAPPLDLTVSTTIGAATKFLYTGGNPIQTGVAPGTIDFVRAAVLRGRVLDQNSQPLANVQITILNHPELGQTRSRADGMFDLAVNGGGLLTINFAKTGFLPAQRSLNVPWQDYQRVSNVVMLPFDDAVTTIDLNSGSAVQVAEGTAVTDSSGSRRTVLMFKQGTTATMTLPNGSLQGIPLLHVRATEFTAGPIGPSAMPGVLPPTSFYTYAADYSIDEAVAANATGVAFSQPVVQYNENFLNFPVGTVVPSGSYDKTTSFWVSSASGLVIKILSISGGVANLDIDGSGNAASDSALASLGVNLAERQQLATIYHAGQTLWRVPVNHFSPWDFNWPYLPPAGAQPPNQPPPTANKGCDCDRLEGPNIGVDNQDLNQGVSVTGSSASLNYGSNRQAGLHSVLTIPLSGNNVPASLKRIDLTIQIAGRTFSQSFPATTNQQTSFEWDGRDAYGRTMQGGQFALVKVAYVYDFLYAGSTAFAEPGSGEALGPAAREEGTLSQVTTVPLGHFDARALGLGGWNLSIEHYYDPNTGTLYLGDGTQKTFALQAQSANLAGGNAVISTVINAFDSQLLSSIAAVAPDGSMVVVGKNQKTIYRVGGSGNAVKIAGDGINVFSGDGGPAINAAVSPSDIAVAKDGSIYFYNFGGARIRKIDPNGIIRTVAGNGGQGSSGDGGPATQAQIGPIQNVLRIADDSNIYLVDRASFTLRKVRPDGIITTVLQQNQFVGTDIALGSDGSLYFLGGPTFEESNKVKRLTPDGVTKTVAGGGSVGSGDPDGVQATSAELRLGLERIAVAPDGTIYFSETGNNHASIRRVTPDGILSTIAGINVPGFSGDGGFAAAAQISTNIEGLDLGPDGNLYLIDFGNSSFRRVSAPLPRYNGAAFLIPSEDGSEIYHFDANGKHLSTTNALTGATLYSFTYDSAGLLTQITDGDGNITTIERDASENPTGIVSPYNQRTALALDANGYLKEITDPASHSYQYSSTSQGLMTGFTDPRGNSQSFDYDGLGRLTRATNSDTGVQTLVRTDSGQNYRVAFTTAENRMSNYDVVHISADSLSQIETDPNGLQTFFIKLKSGNNTLLTPDGMNEVQILGADPRFGVTAPVVASDTTSTPGGLGRVVGATRAVTLSSPNDPLSLATETDTVSINGLSYTSVFTASSKSFALTTPTGRQGKSTIDAQGRITQSQFGNLNQSAFSYDSRGRLSNATYGSVSEARAYVFNYDSAGFLSSVADPLNHTESYLRDGVGRITQRTLRDGRIITYGYDASGNLTSITPPSRPAHTFNFSNVNLRSAYIAPNVGGSSQTTFAYNKDRQLTTVTRPDAQTINFGYDAGGRLGTLTIPGGQYVYSHNATTGKLSGITAPAGDMLAFDYDGTLLQKTTWVGSVAGNVSHTFDNFFRVTSQSVNDGNSINLSYDDDNLLTKVGDLSLTRNAQNGLLTGSTIGNVTDTISYNGFAEPTAYNATFNATQLLNEQYTRDKLGRITQKSETINGLTKTYAYGYDNAGRLSTVTLNGAGTPSVTYSYDGNSNRLSANYNGSPINGTYDAQDRLTQYGGITYAYSTSGELQSKTEASVTTQYSYDVLDNLTHVTLPNATQIDYVIDGQNRRVGKKTNGTLTQGFLYGDQLRVVAELDGNNNLVSRFVYGTRSNVPDYMIKGGATYRIISDHLGSPRLIVDVSTGAIAQEIDYDEFGFVVNDTNPGFQPFGFAGGLYDKDTGLVRFGARDYDAQTGRWATKDPILFAGGDTNLYGYVLEDPVNFIDANGRRYMSASDNPGANDNRGGDYIQYYPTSDFGPSDMTGGASSGSNDVITNAKVTGLPNKVGDLLEPDALAAAIGAGDDRGGQRDGKKRCRIRTRVERVVTAVIIQHSTSSGGNAPPYSPPTVGPGGGGN